MFHSHRMLILQCVIISAPSALYALVHEKTHRWWRWWFLCSCS